MSHGNFSHSSPKQQPKRGKHQHPNKHGKKSDNHKKVAMHPNNIHVGRYDLARLGECLPALLPFLTTNPSGQATIDFSDAHAVKALNQALLMYHYDLSYWDIPTGFLCPPIPSRADYIHHIAELVDYNKGSGRGSVLKTPQHDTVKVLDIGTGANCIYPLIGSYCYDWQFVATDIDTKAIAHAQHICDNNDRLQDIIELRHQSNADHIFTGIIKDNEQFDITMCNPPFHRSMEEAMDSNNRKQRNLAHHKAKKNPQNNAVKNSDTLNFGGQKAELWCEGGERMFLQRMAKESLVFSQQVRWFTTLVSKAENIAPLQYHLRQLHACTIKEIPMSHGQKTTRVIAWSWQH